MPVLRGVAEWALLEGQTDINEQVRKLHVGPNFVEAESTLAQEIRQKLTTNCRR